ncbi:MAG: NAD+ synthase [Anaerolineales bacterium]|nr:NAD+ synthase [Anaerolineales bacterium]
MIDLSINSEKVRKSLIDFIYTYITSSSYPRAVLGLSGGLDSAVSCYLAAEALGPQNVLAVRMPYKTSSRDSLEHAQLVIDALGVQALDVDISGMVDALFDQFADANQLRRGNAMARARMIVLYDQSEAFRGLVLGSSNKSEILLGYTTIFGDSAYALNPLGDLYKTQVRQLARALGVPEVIIAKPPSADLWENQTDEGELGFTYAEVDQLLYLLVEKDFTLEECEAAGFDSNFVWDVVQRMRANQFKRFPSPVAKVGK